jgi:hypothetical protein
MSKHVVAAVADLPSGSRRLVRIGERAIVDQRAANALDATSRFERLANLGAPAQPVGEADSRRLQDQRRRAT